MGPSLMGFLPLLLYKPLKYFQWGLEPLAPYQSPDGLCHRHRDKSIKAFCPLPSFGQSLESPVTSNVRQTPASLFLWATQVDIVGSISLKLTESMGI